MSFGNRKLCFGVKKFMLLLKFEGIWGSVNLISDVGCYQGGMMREN